jgi:hypothetical protein
MQADENPNALVSEGLLPIRGPRIRLGYLVQAFSMTVVILPSGVSPVTSSVLLPSADGEV